MRHLRFTIYDLRAFLNTGAIGRFVVRGRVGIASRSQQPNSSTFDAVAAGLSDTAAFPANSVRIFPCA